MKKTGAERIAAERARQIEKEGWTAEHDQEHSRGELGQAAACYLDAAVAHARLGSLNLAKAEQFYLTFDSLRWPWDSKWLKLSDDPIRNLEKAGALIAAEIDRLLAERKNLERDKS